MKHQVRRKERINATQSTHETLGQEERSWGGVKGLTHLYEEQW
jgi:hypothetical protein